MGGPGSIFEVFGGSQEGMLVSSPSAELDGRGNACKLLFLRSRWLGEFRGGC